MTDDELLASFEARTLRAFPHEHHVRVAFAILAREGDLAAGALRFRRGLRAFAAATGLTGKYHETLTWAYLALVWQRLRADPADDSRPWLARHPDLLDHRGGALARHYDVDAITASPLAREVFVLPERR